MMLATGFTGLNLWKVHVTCSVVRTREKLMHLILACLCTHRYSNWSTSWSRLAACMEHLSYLSTRLRRIIFELRLVVFEFLYSNCIHFSLELHILCKQCTWLSSYCTTNRPAMIYRLLTAVRIGLRSSWYSDLEMLAMRVRMLAELRRLGMLCCRSNGWSVVPVLPVRFKMTLERRRWGPRWRRLASLAPAVVVP